MSNSYQLRDAVSYSTERVGMDTVTLDNYVTTDNLLQNKLGLTRAVGLPPQNGNLPAYSEQNILLANIRPYLKKIWFSNKKGGCSADVLVFSVKKEFNPKFVYYAMFRDEFFSHVMNGSKGTKMPRGDKNQILYFTIPRFEKSEQEKIASVLSVLDAKIELNNRINNELEAMVKTLYDYWFVQFDFPNKNDNPYKYSGGKMVYNEILKREIPDGWERIELGQITSVSNDSITPLNSPNGEYRYFSIPTFDETKTYRLEKGRNIGSNKFVVGTSDLLVSKLNPWFNRIVYVMDEEQQICSTEFVVWRTPNDEIKSYLYSIAKSQQFISYCMQSATGTSNSHKRVNPTVMMQYAVPFKNSVAVEFGIKVNPMILKILKNQRENQQLAQLRDWLLPILMNGQIKHQ